MVNDIVQYIREALEFVFLSGGTVQIIIAVVVALLGGFMLKKYSFGAAVNTTFLVLVIYVVALAVYQYIDQSMPEFGPWLESQVNAFLDITLGNVLTAFVAFFIVISIAHFLIGAVAGKKG